MQIKDIREEKEISLRQLSVLSGVSLGYISDVERNRKMPTIYIMCCLAAALDVQPEELYIWHIK